MFVPVFTINLNQKILPGRVTVGEFDGKNPCLAAATTAEKVLIHNPHRDKSQSGKSCIENFFDLHDQTSNLQ